MHINDMVQGIKEGIGATALAQHRPCSCHLVWQDLLDACMETRVRGHPEPAGPSPPGHSQSNHSPKSTNTVYTQTPAQLCACSFADQSPAWVFTTLTQDQVCLGQNSIPLHEPSLPMDLLVWGATQWLLTLPGPALPCPAHHYQSDAVSM